MRSCLRAFLVALVVMSACAVRAQGCATQQGPAYLDGRNPDRLSVVVFIHGVLSDSVGAWSTGEVSWPCLLRREPSFNSSNVYLHAYPTHLLDKSPSIEQLGARLIGDLLADEVFQGHTNITIVAHSMGGLVTASMLLRLQADPTNKHWLDRIKVVTFYATPAGGADIARAAAYLSPNLQFPDIANASGIADNWLKVKWPFRHRCFAEGRRTGWSWFVGTKVVMEESASRLCDGQEPAAEVLFAHDHLAIVKPSSLQDEPHRHLYRIFKACVDPHLPGQAAIPHPHAGLAFKAFADIQAALADATTEGKLKRQQVVETWLVQDGPANSFFMPRTMESKSLREADYERLAFRVFANQFVNHFQSQAGLLKTAWTTPVNSLPLRVRDGRLLELTRRWLDAGLMNSEDVVMAAEGPHGQFLLVFQSDQTAGGAARARLKGVIALPPATPAC